MSNEITLLPDYVDIVQQPSVEFYRSATNLLSAFDDYIGQLDTSIQFEKSKVTADVIKSTSVLYGKLNDDDFKITFDGEVYEFDNIFKLFYIEKFQTLTDDVKSLITSNLTGDNIYFNNYSDDTGNITDVNSVIDNNTSPYFDTFDATYNYPNSIPASIFNKVSKRELQTSVNLNIKTDALLKLSLSDIQGSVDANTAKTSHGENLVTDNLYVDRLYLFKDPINSQLKNIIGNMADFIQFFKNVNFRDQDKNRSSVYLKYTTNIEGVSAKIDILKNKLNQPIKVSLN
jgi:hypothetical protein